MSLSGRLSLLCAKPLLRFVVKVWQLNKHIIWVMKIVSFELIFFPTPIECYCHGAEVEVWPEIRQGYEIYIWEDADLQKLGMCHWAGEAVSTWLCHFGRWPGKLYYIFIYTGPTLKMYIMTNSLNVNPVRSKYELVIYNGVLLKF